MSYTLGNKCASCCKRTILVQLIVEMYCSHMFFETQCIFVFHCNYGRILYRFRNKARYWSKNTKFFIPFPFKLHDHLEPLGFFPKILIKKLSMLPSY